MAGEIKDTITLGDEVEGDVESTSDYLFFKIGASVPLNPSGPGYDPDDPPTRPLAVSQRFGLLFLAHAEGFVVVRTKDAIQLAKELRASDRGEKVNGVEVKARHSCIQELRIVDVRIGNVTILEVSKDSSAVVAAVGGIVHLFQVSSLMRKEQDPLIACSLNESGHVKDLLFSKNQDNSFVVLSTSGSLYQGNSAGHLKSIMLDVDAVDWSTEGNLLVARKNCLSILSPKLKQEFHISLSSRSLSNTPEGSQIRVDSIKWLHSNIIIVGYFQVNADGIEEDYLIHVLSSREHEFTALSKPYIVSFSGFFHGIGYDLLPFKTGPHLFANFLERWGIAVVANRKNAEDHVMLLKLPVDDKMRKAVLLEFEHDKYIPKIEIQESGDENLILGLAADKVSLYEKVEFIDGVEIKELSPYCILLCFSSEGKLIMYHVASVSDPYVPIKDSFELSCDHTVAEEVVCPTSNESSMAFSQLNNGINEVFNGNDPHNPKVELGVDVNFPQSGEGFTGSAPEEPVCQSSASEKLAVRSLHAQGFHLASDTPSKAHEHQGAGTRNVGSAAVQKPLHELFSSGKPFLSNASTVGNVQVPCRMGTRTSGGQNSTSNLSLGFKCLTPMQSGISASFSAPPKGSPDRVRHTEAVPSTTGPAIVAKEAIALTEHICVNRPAVSNSHRGRSGTEISNTVLDLPRQFYSVDDTVKELDKLLLDIEQEGGFADACTVQLKNSVFALDKGLEKLSEASWACKRAVTQLVSDIQHLQDKMVQISAREGYMEEVVKQASNRLYWDVWNRQKLGPEFELKQQQITRATQNLRSQLVELERHFHMLELNKFGESGARKGQRALTGPESSRRIHTLHRLHNTVTSQLAAAEQLSDHLSAQMASLKITSPSAKRLGVAKELLESIGVSQLCQSFESPDVKNAVFSPDSHVKVQQFSLSSTADKQHPRRYTSSTFNNTEPETVRRQRKSLDRSWASFEPQKTTVKRLVQRERFMGSIEVSSSANKVNLDSQKMRKINALHGKVNDSSPSLSSSLKILHFATLENKELDENSSKQQFESELSSLFRSPRNFPGSLQLEHTKSSKSHVVQDVQQRKVHASSSLTVPSIPFSNFQHSDAVQTGGLPDYQPFRNESVSKVMSSANTTMPAITEAPLKVTSPFSVFPSPEKAKIQASKLSNVSGVAENILLSSATIGVKSGQGTSGSMGAVQLSPSIAAKGNPVQVDAIKCQSLFAEASILSRDSIPFSSPTNASSTAPPLSSQVVSSATLINTSVIDSTTTSEGLLNARKTNTITKIMTPTLSFKSTVNSSSSPILPADQSPQTSPPFSIISVNTAAQLPLSPPAKVDSSSEPTASSISLLDSPDGLTLDDQPILVKPVADVPSMTSISTSGISSSAAPEIEHVPIVAAIEKDVNLDFASTQGDEMDEETPETVSPLNLGSFGGFGLGSSSTVNPQKTNLFDGAVVSSSVSPVISPFSLITPPGQLFKPASFSIPSVQPTQSSPQMSIGGGSGGFGGFGQPAQIGAAQPGLGSVLGSFGQSRQLGSNQASGFASPGSFASGGFSAAAKSGMGFASSGGFAAAPNGGGFAGAATGGGFAAAATSSGHSFVGAAAGGGFASAGGAAASPGGFAGAASGGGFAGATSGGGFAAIGSSSGGFGFAGSSFAGAASGGFGNVAGAGKPSVEFLMQMRK